MQRIVIKKYFLFTVGNICHVNRSKVADDAQPGAEVAETTVKRFLCYEFRRTGKATGKVYQYWSRICREINVFLQVRVSHVLRFMFICGLFTDSPSYKEQISAFERSINFMNMCRGGGAQYPVTQTAVLVGPSC
jgi:hypothetical protein